ncbi:MAG: RnfABCDGE type electron transport complex subunit G [Lachnospiraceae bacterium]|nr:RnfABCDGE type electron transport complex subunit G [Lachnospiraceae bacterium]
MRNSNSIVKNTLVLFVIAVILAAVLGIVNELTKDRIAEQEEKTKSEAYQAVYTEAVSFEEDEELTAKVAEAESLLAEIDNSSTIEEALVAVDADGNVLGIVVNITNPEGYGGDINLSIGVSTDGTMTGMKVVSNDETAGLGANCTKDSFQSQFAGIQSSEIAYSKTGATADNEIDAISSATFTTSACVNAVNAGLAFAYDYLGLN